MSEHPKYAITLIHGTFAAESAWYQKDSVFARDIQNNLGQSSEIFSFAWSGSNSHASRIAAGDDLAQHMQRIYLKYPSAEQIIIAHSHGGNVALYAVKKLADPLFEFKIVTLSTPFLIYSVRENSKLYRIIPVAAVAVIAPIFVVCCAGLLTIFLDWVTKFGPEWLFGVGIVLGGMQAVTMTVSLSGKLYSRVKLWTNSLNSKSDDLWRNLTTSSTTDTRILSLIYEGDEASYLLLSSSRLNELGKSLSTMLEYSVNLIVSNAFKIVGLFGLAIAMTVILDDLYFNGELQGKSEGYFIYFIILILQMFQHVLLLILVLYCVSLATKSNPLVYGWESFYHIFLLKTTISKTPNHIQNHVHKTYRVEKKRRITHGLRHSLIYSDSLIVKDIAKWIES
jgi:hypothetical protein